MGCKHREPSLKLRAVAGRALRRFAVAHQRLELVVTFLARVFEQRHESILTRVGAIPPTKAVAVTVNADVTTVISDW